MPTVLRRSRVEELRRKAWLEPDTYASVLLGIAVKEFDKHRDPRKDKKVSCLDWTPRTLIAEVEQTFGVDLDIHHVDLLMAGVLIATTDRLYQDERVFNDMCHVLSNEMLTPGVFIPTDVCGMAWGVTEAWFLHPPENGFDGFSPEVAGFIDSLCKEEGLVRPPKILSMAGSNATASREVEANFADDPGFLQDIWRVEASKTADIDSYIRDRLENMVRQLTELELIDGDQKQVAHQLEALLHSPNN